MIYDQQKDYDGSSTLSYFKDGAVTDYTTFKSSGNCQYIVFNTINGNVYVKEIRDEIAAKIKEQYPHFRLTNSPNA